MADYQIKALDTGHNLFTLINSDFEDALDLAKNASCQLDGPVAIMGVPIDGIGFTSELWRSE